MAQIEKAPTVRGLLAYGSEMRPERNVEGDFARHSFDNYAIGAGYESFLFILERATFEETSGNSTLNVRRQYEDSLLWAQWRSFTWKRLVPFVGGGAGIYKEKIKTTFSGAVSNNETDYKLLTGACFGLSVDIPVMWLSIEGRLLFGDELDHQPTLGGIVRIGLWL